MQCRMCYELVTKMSSWCSLTVAFHSVLSRKLQVNVNAMCIFSAVTWVHPLECEKWGALVLLFLQIFGVVTDVTFVWAFASPHPSPFFSILKLLYWKCQDEVVIQKMPRWKFESGPKVMLCGWWVIELQELSHHGLTSDVMLCVSGWNPAYVGRWAEQEGGPLAGQHEQEPEASWPRQCLAGNRKYLVI